MKITFKVIKFLETDEKESIIFINLRGEAVLKTLVSGKQTEMTDSFSSFYAHSASRD